MTEVEASKSNTSSVDDSISQDDIKIQNTESSSFFLGRTFAIWSLLILSIGLVITGIYFRNESKKLQLEILKLKEQVCIKKIAYNFEKAISFDEEKLEQIFNDIQNAAKREKAVLEFFGSPDRLKMLETHFKKMNAYADLIIFSDRAIADTLKKIFSDLANVDVTKTFIANTVLGQHVHFRGRFAVDHSTLLSRLVSLMQEYAKNDERMKSNQILIIHQTNYGSGEELNEEIEKYLVGSQYKLVGANGLNENDRDIIENMVQENGCKKDTSQR